MENERDLTILKVIRSLEELSVHGPCKKTVQKMVYLMEEAGKELGFRYTIHFYGPYSAELDYEVQNLTSQGVLEIRYTNYGHFLSVPADDNSNLELDKVEKNVIDWFGNKNASDLELIATALFVQRNVGQNNINSVVSGVRKIKGSKYSDKQIDDAIEELKEHQYF